MTQTPSDPSPEELLLDGRWLRRVALSLVADEATADDLAQDAWAERANREGASVRDPRAFLAGVVKNLARRRRRSEARRHERETRAARSETLEDDDPLDRTLETQRALLEELAALPDDQRRTILARFYDDQSAAEIARRRGVPAATVRAWLKAP